MAILRAGPFASFSNYFLDEPSPLVYDLSPVNCALDTSSSNWPWKSLRRKRTQNSDLRSIQSGLPNESITGTGTRVTSGLLVLSNWRYQATEPFSFDVTYSGSTTSNSSGNYGFAYFYVDVDYIRLYSDSSSSGSIGATTTINLPASVTPTNVTVGVGFGQAVNSPPGSYASYTVS
jgi:hypothetical protein